MKNKLLIVLLLIVAMTLIGIPQASARPEFLLAFNEYYPTANIRLNTCDLCHGVSTFLNPYGANVSHSMDRTGGMRIPNFSAIESIDSDGDGYTNIREISAGSFPGNASSYPDNIFVTVEIDQPTIIPAEPESPGHYIIGHIKLPKGYYVKIIDMKSITLGFSIPGVDPKPGDGVHPELNKVEIGAFDQEMTLKFDRNKVVGLLGQNGIFKEKLLYQKIDLTITGRFINQKTTFEGTDTVKFIHKGK